MKFMCKFETWRSARTAVFGLRYAILREKNFFIQSIFAIVVLTAALFLEIEADRVIILIIVIALVLALELVNSAIEKTLDLVKPRLHEQVQIVKDMMAGAVLLAVFFAAVIGCLIFFPAVIEFMSGT